jgi:Spy/CpxP family protein refolding chaperone
MCGFFFGLLGALIVFKVASHRHHLGGCGGHHRRFRHHHGYGHGHGRRFERRRRHWMDWLFTRLDTTHGQEKVILDAAREVEDAVRGARGLGKKQRRDLGDILRGESFDHEAVGQAWTEQDEALEKARMAVLTALQRVHEVLEPRQRAQLADMIDGGW